MVGEFLREHLKMHVGCMLGRISRCVLVDAGFPRENLNINFCIFHMNA